MLTSKHEVACWAKDDAEQGWNETMLWSAQSVFLDVWDQIPDLVCEESSDSNDAAHSDGQESKAGLTQVEVVNGRVDEWEHFERRIVNTVDQSGLLEMLERISEISRNATHIKIGKGNSRILEHDLHRLDQCLRHYLTRLHLRLVDF